MIIQAVGRISNGTENGIFSVFLYELNYNAMISKGFILILCLSIRCLLQFCNGKAALSYDKVAIKYDLNETIMLERKENSFSL